MGAICRSFGQEESRRKGPAPIIWGAGCTMQTTMRGTLRTNDVRPFVHSSRFVERVVSLLLPTHLRTKCKIALRTWDKYERSCSSSRQPITLTTYDGNSCLK